MFFRQGSSRIRSVMDMVMLGFSICRNWLNVIGDLCTFLDWWYSVSSCAGKVINLKRLDKVITSINDWYMERGLFAMVRLYALALWSCWVLAWFVTEHLWLFYRYRMLKFCPGVFFDYKYPKLRLTISPFVSLTAKRKTIFALVWLEKKNIFVMCLT